MKELEYLLRRISMNHPVASLENNGSCKCCNEYKNLHKHTQKNRKCKAKMYFLSGSR